MTSLAVSLVSNFVKVATGTVGVYCLSISIINYLFDVVLQMKLKQRRKNTKSQFTPKVYVLLPARNESANISQCLDSLMKQDYSGQLRVLVMDDNSSDDTFVLSSKFAAMYPQKVFVYQSNPVPEDWYGKSYALHQLHQIAINLHEAQEKKYKEEKAKAQADERQRQNKKNICDNSSSILSSMTPKPLFWKCVGEQVTSHFHNSDCVIESKEKEDIYFVLTDADTIHEANSISSSLEYIEYYSADFISGFPRQVLDTWAERLTIPIMFIVKLFIPFWIANSNTHPCLTFAIGQYMVISGKVFQALNGMQGVAKEVCEDLALARLVRKQGFSSRFLPFSSFVSCRMYRSYKESFFGLSKAIYPAISSHPLLAGLFIVATLILTIFPASLAATRFLYPTDDACSSPSCSLCSDISLYMGYNGLMLLAWALVLNSERIPLFYSLFWILSSLNAIVMSIYSIIAMTCSNGILWKQRRVR